VPVKVIWVMGLRRLDGRQEQRVQARALTNQAF